MLEKKLLLFSSLIISSCCQSFNYNLLKKQKQNNLKCQDPWGLINTHDILTAKQVESTREQCFVLYLLIKCLISLSHNFFAFLYEWQLLLIKSRVTPYFPHQEGGRLTSFQSYLRSKNQSMYKISYLLFGVLQRAPQIMNCFLNLFYLLIESLRIYQYIQINCCTIILTSHLSKIKGLQQLGSILLT